MLVVLLSVNLSKFTGSTGHMMPSFLCHVPEGSQVACRKLVLVSENLSNYQCPERKCFPSHVSDLCVWPWHSLVLTASVELF